MIAQERIRRLGGAESPLQGEYVLYWMEQSQRVLDNHALSFAIDQANNLGLPVLVLFALTPDFPETNARHYWFMLQGLRHTAGALAEMGIKFICRVDSPPSAAEGLSRDAALVITDMGYLKIQRLWRRQLAGLIKCPLIQVESDVIVPVETASTKEQYSAATLRPRIYRRLTEFLVPLKIDRPWKVFPEKGSIVKRKNNDIDIADLDKEGMENLLVRLNIDKSVYPVEWISGGTDQALMHLDNFVNKNLIYFHSERNDPSRDILSNMSPYLHFGQISPLTIALRAISAYTGPVFGSENAEVSLDCFPEGTKSFLEELIVRRELSKNFTHYNDTYDSLDSLDNWASNTLFVHRADHRPVLYSSEQLENACTLDEYWNACQTEMVCRGKMHGYMRMYWGKKIIEWSPSAEEAYRRMVFLNNKFSLDGRDSNGYTGIAWCFGKHDRAWKERAIFGKIRYMNSKGLERKFDIKEYVRRINNLCPEFHNNISY